MRNLSFLWKVVAFSLCIVAISNQTKAQQGVYVGGKGANVWKNGNPTRLTTGFGCVYSVVVDNGDVYAAGFEDSLIGSIHRDIATVWKNGVLLYRLSDGTNHASAYSIAIDGGDVYVAGEEAVSGSYDYVGKLWKNGIADTGYTDAAGLNSVFIDGNDVYVAGYEGTWSNPVGKVWKNGTPLFTMGSYVKSIVVLGGDVYSAGYRGTNPYYFPTVWKNDTLLYDLAATNNGTKLDLCISNGDIYVAGLNDVNCGATIWKNGGDANGGQTITYRIGSSRCNAYGVFVSDSGDIYVAGEVADCGNYIAAVWKNGVATILPNSSTAYCIFVADSNSSSSGHVDIVETHNYVALRIYPNPVSYELQVTSYEGGSIEIYDVVGQKLTNFQFSTINSQLNIDVSHLASGMYFLKVDNKVVRFVKE